MLRSGKLAEFPEVCHLRVMLVNGIFASFWVYPLVCELFQCDSAFNLRVQTGNAGISNGFALAGFGHFINDADPPHCG